MKVKEFIEHLKTLDQDKDIHIVYDCYCVFDPEVEVAEDDWEKRDGTFEYRKGDYLIKAG